MTANKKLIEVALPLEAINEQSAREKSIRHGHPSTLHLWWARRPLAACRAVLFAQLIDDPSALPDRFPTDEAQSAERHRLFQIIEALVDWDNSADPRILELARREIRASCGEPPAILDPFAGGGAIPIEAQRLGLRALAGDLNPVATLITRAMIDLPARFWDQPPANPKASDRISWSGGQGLAEDIAYYGERVLEMASERIGAHYPDAVDDDGAKRPVIAWIWARTVRSPNPAWPAHVPLVRSWDLRRRKGKPGVWVEPSIDRRAQTITYNLREGEGAGGEPTVSRSGGICLATNTAIPLVHIKREGMAGRMGQHLLAVIAEGNRRRLYLDPTDEQLAAASVERPADAPSIRLSQHPQYMGTPRYGLLETADHFSPRQLLALTTFSDCIQQLREEIRQDAAARLDAENDRPLRDGGTGAVAYSEAIATYLAFALDRCADYWSNVCSWHNTKEQMRNTFSRQAIPMAWDFAEANPFSTSTGNWTAMVDWVRKAVERAVAPVPGEVRQQTATDRIGETAPVVVSTDPPYYDNVPYADISDFFYVWLRHNLAEVWPDELATIQTPKQDELVADYLRHGSKEAARAFFELGMQQTFRQAKEALPEGYPLTIFYAFKAAETVADGRASTGWDTFLHGLIDSGLTVTSTWPVRTELSNRPRAIGAGALATSIVLTCRPRAVDAAITTRREFQSALASEMPTALRDLQTGNIAPIDLPQAAIGPGIAVFSRYGKVLMADGSAMGVRDALIAINNVLGEVLFEQEGDFDNPTRWAVSWYEQHGFADGPFGDADNLSKAKGTAVDGVVASGVASRRGDKVRLVRRDDLPTDWDPTTDKRLTVWEVTQHLIRRLDEGGEMAAAQLIRQLGGMADLGKELAYLLFAAAERRKDADDAIAYNSLVVAWPQLTRLAADQPAATATQAVLDL